MACRDEYVVEDFNQWWFLALSGRRAGATSVATQGVLSRSARHRSREAYGIGDELRGSFVARGAYWGAAGFLRNADNPWFTEDDVRTLAGLSELIADGFRRALLTAWTKEQPVDAGPGIVIFGEGGKVESISPAAELWIGEMVEIPRPASPDESKVLQVVAASARASNRGDDPLEVGARSRVQTKSGRWLVLYGTRLSGAKEGRTAVIIQPATPHEVAPLMALAYGLSECETEVTSLCMKGQATKEMARTLGISQYTVQDHLKSIFEKTGARSRGALVGQIFLEHYASQWEDAPASTDDWLLKRAFTLGFPRPNANVGKARSTD